jgi:hypothetical protein
VLTEHMKIMFAQNLLRLRYERLSSLPRYATIQKRTLTYETRFQKVYRSLKKVHRCLFSSM